MDMLVAILPFAKDASPIAIWVALFVAALVATQRLFGGWFEMARQSAAGHADAQLKTNDTMLRLIEKLNAEIERLSSAELRIMERLAECEQRHRARDAEFEKLQNEVSALHLRLFSAGDGS